MKCALRTKIPAHDKCTLRDNYAVFNTYKFIENY